MKKIIFLFFSFLLYITGLFSIFFDYKQDNNLLILFFYYNESCKFEIKEINFSKSYETCIDALVFDIFKDNIINKRKINVFFKLDNQTVIKEIKIKNISYFNYKIFPKTIKISDKVNLRIITNAKGSLEILGNYFALKEGENLIDITNLLERKKILGKITIKIELCKENFCQTFKDFLLIERSPVFCNIEILENNFPHYLTFNFTVLDQEREIYIPKIIFFDMELLPFKEKGYYKVIFPKFHPSGEFVVNIKVDGKTCLKKVELDYSKYFYAISDPLEKKLNITRIFLQNPYKSEEKILLFLTNENKTYLIELKPLELKNLKEKFGKFEVIYNNKTIYSFEPKVIEGIYSNLDYYFKIFLIIFIISLIFLNSIIFFLSSK